MRILLTVKLHHYFPVAGYWVRLNGDNPICFLGWGDTPGKFESRYDGFVGALKLVHINGKITCDRNKPSYKSNWGCYKEDKNLLCIFITDLNKNLLFNRTGGDLGNNVKKYWYGSKIFGPDSEEIVFSRMEDPQFVNSGFQMRIWYGEDLGNIDEINNDGQTCVDVYAHFV